MSHVDPIQIKKRMHAKNKKFTNIMSISWTVNPIFMTMTLYSVQNSQADGGRSFCGKFD